MATYASKLVTVVYGGVPLSGTMDGTHVEVTEIEPGISMLQGNDGQTARAIRAGRGFRVVVRLLQTSASNDYLSNQYLLDIASGLNTKPLFIKDASGRSVNTAQEAWVVGLPSQTFADGIEGREWTFETGDMQAFPAGNP